MVMGSSTAVPQTKLDAGNTIGELMVSIINKLINHDIIIVSKWHSSLDNFRF